MKDLLNSVLRQSTWMAVIFGGWVAAGSAQGAIIPADRMAPWRGNVGVFGGIPASANMTVFANLPAGSSAAAINSAITACPSNQVVQLAAGTYNLTARLVGKSGVVLRGAGMTNTILVPQHGNYGGCIYVGNSYVYQAIYSGNYNGGGTANWTAGYVQGSSNLTFSGTTGLAVGSIVTLDQLNDPFYVNTTGYEGNNRAGRGSGARALQQYSRVTAINGNVVTIWPPVAAPIWSASFSPQAFWVGPNGWIRRFGIEDLTVDGTGLGGGDPYRANIFYETAQDCWIKNVKSLKPTVAHVSYYGAINCEVRRSIFYDTKNAATMSYGIVPLFCSWLLIEDNIFEKVVAPVILGSTATCSVMGYNYSTNMYYAQANNFLMASFQPHSSHTYMWLTEGNYIGSKVDGDFVHGSGSHHVLFRNRITGWAAYTYPGGPSANNLQCIRIDITNRVWSSVGNILGTAPVYVNYQSVPGARAGEPVIYRVGIENTAYGKNWGDDPYTYSTFYRHMDYDTVTGGVRYNPTNSDVTLPNSLYYTSKPSFFGSMPWPPYDPLNVKPSDVSTSSMSYTNIPAGYRHAFGRDPASGPVNLPPIANASATPTNGATPLAVSFSSAGSSDPEGATLTYNWTFGDGGTSTAANPSHTYQNAGTFNAQLTVSDRTNTASSGVVTIRAVVPGLPVAVASATPTSGVAPLSVTFSSAGSYDPEGTTLTYAWTFGDGTTSTAANPSHTYAAGTFTARLTVSDGNQSSSSGDITISAGSGGAAGLVAAYSFDEGLGGIAADVSGNGNHGTISGATWTTNGHAGKALVFNGSDNLVSINPSASLAVSSGVTLEAWVYPTTLGGWRVVLYKGVDIFALEGSTPQGAPSFGGTFSPTAPLYGSASLPLNAWSHLAGTYDGITMRLYVNGLEVAARAQTGPIASSSEPVTIGGDSAYNQWWAGRIDEVRIYNRALSATEIVNAMQTPVGSTQRPATPQAFRILGE